MRAAILEAEAISVSYGRVQAVLDVNISVPTGSVVTVLGANGAGKTTLLSALMGLLPCKGTIRSGDARIDHLPVQERFAHGICLVPEKRELFSDMSVADNLLLGGYVNQRSWGVRARETRNDIYELFPRLRERATQKANTLSGGERQMLALGRALMARPQLLMLDEPSLGLAPLVIREMFNTIVRIRKQGLSILLVEQNARMALKVADYAYVMEQGRVMLEGRSSDIAANPRIISSYLGIGT